MLVLSVKYRCPSRKTLLEPHSGHEGLAPASPSGGDFPLFCEPASPNMLSFWKPTIPPLLFKKLVHCFLCRLSLLALRVVFASAFALALFLIRLSGVAAAAADSLPGLWAFQFCFRIEGGVDCSDRQLANLRVLLEELVIWNSFADVEKALL